MINNYCTNENIIAHVHDIVCARAKSGLHACMYTQIKVGTESRTCEIISYSMTVYTCMLQAKPFKRVSREFAATMYRLSTIVNYTIWLISRIDTIIVARCTPDNLYWVNGNIRFRHHEQ